MGRRCRGVGAGGRCDGLTFQCMIIDVVDIISSWQSHTAHSNSAKDDIAERNIYTERNVSQIKRCWGFMLTMMVFFFWLVGWLGVCGSAGFNIVDCVYKTITKFRVSFRFSNI